MAIIALTEILPRHLRREELQALMRILARPGKGEGLTLERCGASEAGCRLHVGRGLGHSWSSLLLGSSGTEEIPVDFAVLLLEAGTFLVDL